MIWDYQRQRALNLLNNIITNEKIHKKYIKNFENLKLENICIEMSVELLQRTRQTR